MTRLKSVLLMRSVTFMHDGSPRGFDHLHVSDGLLMDLLPSGWVVISEQRGKDKTPVEVYRIGPNNVAGCCLAEEPKEEKLGPPNSTIIQGGKAK